VRPIPYGRNLGYLDRHFFSYTIKFTIFLLNEWVLQIREFHYTDAINNIWTPRNIYVICNTLL
jgi:hypothetical protein